MKTWIFQANPSVFDIDGYLARSREITWMLNEDRMPRDLAVGDRVFMWRAAGKHRAVSGVVASGFIATAPSVRADDPAAAPFWRDEAPLTAPRIQIRIDKFAGAGRALRKTDLELDALLRGLTILSSPYGSSRIVTAAQAPRLEELWANVAASSPSCPFTVGDKYSRQDVYEVLRVPTHLQGGAWDTGYREYDGSIYVFCNVGVPGRTGHDYGNRFDGDELCWYAKGNARLEQPLIQAMLSAEAEVRVFFRTQDRAPFEFAGRATAVESSEATGGKPVFVRWSFRHPGDLHPARASEEVLDPTTLPEGATQRVEVNRYERNPVARGRCISAHGLDCSVCGFNFERAYGARGRGFIHVHHLTQLSSRSGPYDLNPETDLMPVCPNCHAMIHRSAEPISIDELKAMLRR